MSFLGVKQTLTQKERQIATLKGRMKLAEFMSQPEDEFQRFIQDVENDPLFKKLMLLDAKIIRFKNSPWTRVAQAKMLSLDPAITPSRNTFEVESFLAKGKEFVSTIKNLGVDRFRKYFLDGTSGMISKEIARECDLPIETVKKINDFVDKFYLESKLTESTEDNRTRRIYYSTIASIEENNGQLTIGYFYPGMAKGRYLINFERIREMNQAGILSKDEIRETNSLLNKLRLINSRKTAIYEIIQKLMEVQREFLLSGDFNNLSSFTQASLSRKMGVSPSLISRAISGKAICTPQGRQILLKTLFPSERKIRKELIREVMQQEKDKIRRKFLSRPYSDEEIRIQLIEKFAVSVSRRSISDCRKELKIPCSFKRMSQYWEFLEGNLQN